MNYSVKQVAAWTGISIRTLHHYDHIGLLRPEALSPAGYRLYSDQNLLRLQQILLLKELEFSLEAIQTMLDQPGFDRKRALETQRNLLLKKKNRLETILTTLERTLKAPRGGKTMNAHDLFKGFDQADIDAHKKKYAKETKAAYGHTAAYHESNRKTAKYTPADWTRIMNQANEIYLRIARRMSRGPEDAEVQKAVADWRHHITQNYYTCTLEIAKGLGELYVADSRFTKNLDKIHPGLAEFMSAAIAFYCQRAKH